MKRLVVIFIIILLNVMSYSSDFIPRSEYRAMLEPLGLVMNGAIYNFLDGLEQLAFPVYLRIGYEFIF